MAGSRLTPEIADWLEYFEDLGFDDLYLAEPPKASETPRKTGEEKTARRAPARANADTAAIHASGSHRSAASANIRTESYGTDPSSVDDSAEADSETTDRQASSGPIDLTPLDDGTAGERSEELSALAETALGCELCRLCKGRNKVVFGTGHPNADLLLIGEGPGANEDREGLPFIGAAGKLLTKILQAIELDRDQVYITNVVKCRPPNNRNPQPDEAAACRRYLDRQIELIRPRIILALGKVAAQTLLGNDLPLGRMRGEWYEVSDVPTRVTYHPAALLRNERLKRPTWEDVQEVRDRLVALRS